MCRLGALLAAMAVAGACSPDKPSPLPSHPPPAPSAETGVRGRVYWKASSVRTPAEGAQVEVWAQVQTGPFSGYTSRLIAGDTNDRGEFHIDSAPMGARIIAGARHSGAWNPCMAFVGNYQGSASLEIELYPKTERAESVVDATLAGPGPILSGTATADGVAQSGAFIYFESTYETYLAGSPVDGSGRYAFCGLPVTLMFPSRVWIENGPVSCDSSGQNYAVHAIRPSSPSDVFLRDFDLYRCRW